MVTDVIKYKNLENSVPPSDDGLLLCTKGDLCFGLAGIAEITWFLFQQQQYSIFLCQKSLVQSYLLFLDQKCDAEFQSCVFQHFSVVLPASNSSHQNKTKVN